MRSLWSSPSFMLWAALAAAAGCADPEQPAATAPLAEAARPGELVLDTRADGAALFGRLLPVPANADPDRRLALRVHPESLAPALDGATALDARFVDGGLVVVTEAHALAFHGGSDAASAILDTRVEGPLSVRGADVAYVRGAWPELEVARANVQTGVASPVTDGLAPTWNPALAGDGSIVFVSGATGGPKLLRADAAGRITELPATRFPASAVAPRVVDGRLEFEDEAGAAWIDLATGAEGEQLR